MKYSIRNFIDEVFSHLGISSPWDVEIKDIYSRKKISRKKIVDIRGFSSFVNSIQPDWTVAHFEKEFARKIGAQVAAQVTLLFHGKRPGGRATLGGLGIL